MNFKRIILRKKISDFSKKRTEIKRSGNVGLIIDAENLKFKEDWKTFFKQAEIKNEHLKIVICDLKEPKSDHVDAEILNFEDISLWGNFRSEAIKDFKGTDFDFLICDFSEESYSASLLAVSANASVKIGKKADVFNIFDIKIDAKDNQVFRQETLKYLKILNYTN